MKVFVVGATGVAGRRAVRELRAVDHEVTGVARSAQKAALLDELGAHPVEVDLFDPIAVRSAVQGHDAIVNLATKIPSLERAMLPGAWKENDRIRREASRNLVDAALPTETGIYVQEALGFAYTDAGDDWIDEESALDVPPYASSVLEAEGQAARFSAAGGTGIVLRFGQFYAPDSAHTRTMVQSARRGLAPFVGPDEGFLPLIHADDVGRAVAAALEIPAGVYNVVDDEPVRREQLNQAIAHAIGDRPLRSLPSRAAALGGEKVRMLMRSQRVSNRRFCDASGWSPLFPTATDGFQRVIRERETHG